MDEPTEGQRHTFERAFTTDEVRQFAELSRDTQPRHTEPDADGRLLVHGLLTATLPTKIGGDLEILARTMSFEFVRPVYTDETIACTLTLTSVTERDDRYDLAGEVVCENEDGAVVLTADLEGLVEKD